METHEQDKLEKVDYGAFKCIGFLPGETQVDDLTVIKFQGRIEDLVPEHFFPATYTIQVITGGSLMANINNQEYDLHVGGAFFASPDFLLKHPSVSSLCEIYVLSFSRKIAQELAIPFTLAQTAQIYVHPVWQMCERKTQRVVRYMELLKEILDDKNREAAIHLVNSLLLYMAGDFAGGQLNQPQLSRNEEITGRFLSLVDAHCQDQHSLDWYASEMCLSTRYVANTVKQTLGFTASEAIERALTQRAKAILSTSTTPIQEIAEALGFQNQSHFGTFFKRKTGVSPSAFRAKYHS